MDRSWGDTLSEELLPTPLSWNFLSTSFSAFTAAISCKWSPRHDCLKITRGVSKLINLWGNISKGQSQPLSGGWDRFTLYQGSGCHGSEIDQRAERFFKTVQQLLKAIQCTVKSKTLHKLMFLISQECPCSPDQGILDLELWDQVSPCLKRGFEQGHFSTILTTWTLVHSALCPFYMPDHVESDRPFSSPEGNSENLKGKRMQAPEQ